MDLDVRIGPDEGSREILRGFGRAARERLGGTACGSCRASRRPVSGSPACPRLQDGPTGDLLTAPGTMAACRLGIDLPEGEASRTAGLLRTPTGPRAG